MHKKQKSLKNATEVKGKHAHNSNACVKPFEMAQTTKEIKMHLVILLFDSNITGHFSFVHLMWVYVYDVYAIRMKTRHIVAVSYWKLNTENALRCFTKQKRNEKKTNGHWKKKKAMCASIVLEKCYVIVE